MGKLLEELAKAQLEFKPISKSGENPFLHNKYATLDDVVNAIKDALANHGISIIHRTEERGAKTFFISEVKHFEDEESEMSTETAIDTFLKVSDKQTAIQIYGSIITYLRRYHLGMLLNLCTDEDIDGNESKSGGKTTTQPKSTITKPSATQGKVDPTQDETPDPTLAYIARINEMESIFEWRQWVEKHTPDLEKLSEEDKKPIRKLLASRKKELQDKQDKIDADKKATSPDEDAISEDTEPELAGLGDGEKEHKDPTA